MANTGKKKRIKVLVKRIDLDEEHEELKDVHFNSSLSSAQFVNILRATFSIPDNLVLKLRNHRGSLVPISASIMTSSEPYVLEVVQVAQNIQPSPRTIEWPSFNETVAANLQNLVNRVEMLEGCAPDLNNKRYSKISNEIEDMEKKLEFLSKRFDEADNTSWKGMFKRHPLW